MRLYVKQGKLYIANIRDREELIIIADNDITSLDVDFTDEGWQVHILTKLQDKGVKI